MQSRETVFGSLRKIFGGRDQAKPSEDWPSIVLLLKQAHLPTAEQAVEMARAAWGAAAPVELLGTPGPHSFALRVSPLTFALHAFAGRYEVGQFDLSLAQQQSWDQHTAWLSVDLPRRRTAQLRTEGRLGSAYMSLMYFVSKHWSSNCLAMYFPAERITVPNQGNLMDSIRWAGRNGIDVSFLREAKKN